MKGEIDMRNTIMPNDVVLHKQTGEKILVCGVNHEKGELVACGYPFPSIMKIADCEIVERNYEHKRKSVEQIKNLIKYGLTSENYCPILDNILAMLKEHGWNVLTEDADGVIHGLPGDDGQYLMTDGKDIWIDEYVDGVADGIILDSGKDIREITAWMYMPELPKKDRR